MDMHPQDCRSSAEQNIMHPVNKNPKGAASKRHEFSGDFLITPQEVCRYRGGDMQPDNLAHEGPVTPQKYLPEKNEVMPKIPDMTFCCRDIGIDCIFEVRERTEFLLLRKFIEHAETSHNMVVLPADLILKIKNAIKK